MSMLFAPFDANVHRYARPLDRPALDLHPDRASVQALLELTDPVALEQKNVVGSYREYVLAPFLHPVPSRFSDGSFGVLYAGCDEPTALSETRYWAAQPFIDAKFSSGWVRKTHLKFRARAELVEARSAKNPAIDNRIYSTDTYAVSRQYGLENVRTHEGIWYDSVRKKGGQCVGIVKSRCISAIKRVGDIELVWSNDAFTELRRIVAL